MKYLIVTEDNEIVYVTDDWHEANVACYEYSYATGCQCKIEKEED